jgi:hypothetical protein
MLALVPESERKANMEHSTSNFQRRTLPQIPQPSSELKQRCQRGSQWFFRSTDSTTAVARPTIRFRSTGPK